MKVLHLSTGDGRYGAYRAAFRLHQGLVCRGVDSRMLVSLRYTGDPRVRAFSPGGGLPGGLLRRWKAARISRDIRRYAGQAPENGRGFDGDRGRFGAGLPAAVPACDVVTLHHVTDFLDYRDFFKVYPAKTPVAWLLHGMNPFTGGCHYGEECGRYMHACGCCPMLGSHDADDLSARVFARKKRIYEALPTDGRFRLIAPSNWLGRLARQSPLLGRFPIDVIPYALDTDIFKPCDPQGLRDAWDIRAGGKTVLFVAERFAEKRKGLALLIEALRRLSAAGADLQLMCVGLPDMDLKGAGLPVTSLGRIENDRWLALAYSAADVFVIPAVQDNLPSTAMESMACGTPVVGFDSGGIPDMVRPGKTGLLAPVGDVAALADAIARMLADDAMRARMGVECRRTALAEYALDVQAGAYIELYEAMTVNAESRVA